MVDLGGGDLRELRTFPKLLVRLAASRGNEIAIREKDFGIWQSWTWRDYLIEARSLAGGLADCGFERGDKVAIIGDNRPELYFGIMATQIIGGVPVPMYQDSIADEMVFILDHAEVRFAIVEDQEQVDKLLAVREQLPKLEFIIFEDDRGLRHYDETGLLSYAATTKKGADFGAGNPNFVDEEIAKGEGEDIAVMLYTSGTTGQPKGVMLTYENVISTSWSGIEHDNLGSGEKVVAYMPMAWIGDHLFSYGQALCMGFTVNCPESADTVLQDVREIGPTCFFAPPRIWENILTTVMVRIEDSGWVKRKLFSFFMKLAERVGPEIMDGRKVGVLARCLYFIGKIFVYGPLRDNLGFSRMRIAYTAGEAIGPEIFTFYRSIGVNIKQLYGMTEATALVVGQADGEVYADSVGVPYPGVELRIEDSGEVLCRSPGVFKGYYKNQEATEETLTADGWIRSGDAGLIDSEGQLRIIDRAKDVGKLNNGAMFAPKYIENKLKFSPYVREAVAFGNGHDAVTAFINIDLEAVGNWAERRGLSYTSYTDLASKSEVYELVGRDIERVNGSLAQDEKLSSSQITRFLILHKELDPDDNELTRTRKVRRRFIADKYSDLIEALYSSEDSVDIDAQVTFEDGRTGSIQATLAIRDVAVQAAGEIDVDVRAA
ncbi:MAG: AMP-binding protein [Pseudomonadota bacterium]|nr:AMP-binding protein [Pseudomonadota bacterium]